MRRLNRTEYNNTIRDLLGELCVPNLFAATGSPAWGNPDYPWTIGSTLAPYTLEGQVFEQYLSDEKPDASVAMLVQDDDFGAAYEEGFKSAICKISRRFFSPPENPSFK